MAQIEPGEPEVELAHIHSRLEIGRIVAYGLMGALCIAALALPVLAVQGAIHSLAGKKTQIDASIVVSISLTVTLALNGLQYLKGRSRRRELKRLRRRITDLERQLMS